MNYDYLKNIATTDMLKNITLKPKQQIYLMAKLNNIPITLEWGRAEGLTFANALYYIEKLMHGNIDAIIDTYYDNGVLEIAINNYAIISTIGNLLDKTEWQLKKVDILNYTIVKK